MILADAPACVVGVSFASFVRSGDVALIDSPVGWLFRPFLGVGGWLVGMFSMESLILAQDERWRRA